jgi:hypothetical protein
MVKVKSKSELIPTLVYSIISIFYVYFQSSQIISLWDFTNYTDIAVRILNGQIPYLDIPLYTQPGTFVELAISMLIFGKNIYAVYLVILIKQFFIGFILSSLISKLFKNTLFDNLAVKIVWLVLFALLSPWSVVPQNTYDADLAFAILLAIYLLIKFDNFYSQNKFINLFVNLMIVLVITYYPFFFKQTSGLVWLGFMHLYFFIAFIVFKNKMFRYLVLLDIFLISLFLLLEINFSFVSKWWQWAIEEPIENRYLPFRAPLAQLKSMSEYNDIFITIIIISVVLIFVLRKFSLNRTFFIFLLTSFVVVPFNFLQEYSLNDNYLEISWSLLLAPSIFLILVLSLVFNLFNDSPFKIKIITIFSIFTLITNYLAQGIVGSSYGFFQLYLLLILLSFIPLVKNVNKDNFFILKVISLLLVPFIFSSIVVYYSSSKIRMAYVRIDEEIGRYPVLYSWIGTPGEYLAETQTGIDLFEEYIKKGRTAVWPGEDPVALFSSSIPSTQVSLSDPTTNPFYNDVESWLKDQNIEYIVWKSRLHTPGMHQISTDQLEKASKDFNRIEKRGVYFVLKRK